MSNNQWLQAAVGKIKAMSFRTAAGWVVFWVLVAFEIIGRGIFNPIFFAAGFFIATTVYDAIGSRGDEKSHRRNVLALGAIAGICLWAVIDNVYRKEEFVRKVEGLCHTSPYVYNDMVNVFCEEINSAIESYLYTPERDRDQSW